MYQNKLIKCRFNFVFSVSTVTTLAKDYVTYIIIIYYVTALLLS